MEQYFLRCFNPCSPRYFAQFSFLFRLKITFKWHSGQTFSDAGEVFLHTLRIFRRIHPRRRQMIGNRHADAKAMPQRAQLLKRLEAFEGEGTRFA